MELWLIVTATIILIIALFAIVLQWFHAFYTKPLQATIRALVGIIVLLVGTLGIPYVEGAATISLDWGNLLQVSNTKLRVSIGSTWREHALAWPCVTALLAICLIRVPTKSNEQ